MTAGRVEPVRTVPDGIEPPVYVTTGQVPPGPVQIQTPESLERLRVACRVAAEVLLEVGAAVAPGVRTDELDGVAHEAYVRRGAYPSTLHYRGFAKSVCTSVNEVVCHGIPDDRPLAEGDIVNVDVTAYVEGMHGDTSATFVVGGTVDPPTAALVETTRAATRAGIAAIEPGLPVGVIGAAIQALAWSRGFGVVREYGGHGIGAVFHAAPHVSHVVDRRATTLLEPGMTFTVEPMLTAGSERIEHWDDGWTVVTADRLPSAQFEHTVTVTETGAEILTVTADGRTAVDESAVAATR